MDTIKSFYANSTILITGGTGFLGKVLIEKLLRSCPDINSIFLLIRPKKEVSPEQRLVDLQKDKIFNRIRSECPDVLSKLRVFPGDMASLKMGLSASDEQVLLKQVSIVFHLAATVKFDEELKVATQQNTLGTVKVLDLCSRMENLKSVVHVSTAYTNPSLKVVEEKVYRTSELLSAEDFLVLAEIVPSELMDLMEEKIMGIHPNTYTFTKAMTEEIVEGFHKKIPMCIVRPSIISASLSEPYPGWVDSFGAATSPLALFGQGLYHSDTADLNVISDMVPVDIVSNTMITSAWSTWRSYAKDNQIMVINCTSGESNPITWKEVAELSQQAVRENPFKSAVKYPHFNSHTNRIKVLFLNLIYYYLPALLLDVVIMIQGGVPKMVKTGKKIKTASNKLEFFRMHGWTFRDNNMRKLINLVKETREETDFYCDFSDMDWKSYFCQYMLGIRRYLMREDDTSLDYARKRISRLYWVQKTAEFAIAGLSVGLFYTVFKAFNTIQ